MSKIFISIQFIFFALWLPAQHLTGMVIDEQQHPLAFATVGNAKAHIGSYTDGEGKYDIEILGLSDYDTIVISHIGYEERRVTIASLRSSAAPVALTPKNYSLKEVIVKPFDAKDMIRDALSHISENYPNEWSRSQMIYKDYSQVSGHKHHYNFFDFNMYLPSYLAKDSPRLYTQVNQHQLYEERHSLFTIPLKPTDLLRLMYPEKVFSEEQLAKHEFKYLSTTTYEGEVLDVVQFKRLPKKKGEFIAAVGNVYINQQDKGIRFVDFHVYNERSKRFLIVAKVDTVNVNVKVAYKKVEGKYTLDYIVQTTYASGKLLGKALNLQYSTTAKVVDRSLHLKMNEIVMKTEVTDIFLNEKPQDINLLKGEPDMK